MSNLPEDLVEEILCRVPATNLKRLRATCQRWNRLYKDSRFARMHLDRSQKQFLSVAGFADCRFRRMSISPVPVPSVQFKGELKQTDPDNPGVEKFDLFRFLHCDGLLLCVSMCETRLVLWNLLTGETRWITTLKGLQESRTFVFGYCNNNKSYKILSCGYCTSDLQIYDLSSGSWRILDGDDVITPRWSLSFCYQVVSLKGSAYRLATDVAGTRASLSLLKFDFSTEKAVTTPLPRHWHKPVGLSLVREEKMAVLLQQEGKKTEVWLSNKIDQEVVSLSWSKILALELGHDLKFRQISTFLVDEEKKVLMLATTKWVAHAKTLGDTLYMLGRIVKSHKKRIWEYILTWMVVGTILIIMFQVWFESTKLDTKGKEVTKHIYLFD